MAETFAPPRVYRVGIIGMGGFAGTHHRAVRDLEARGWVRLVCTCDPDPERFAELGKDLAERKVDVSRDYVSMLDRLGADLDLVAVPTPVPLHAPMHAAAVQAGVAVYLEKPPTLYHRELEQMIAVDRGAPTPTLVGFNFIGEPTRRRLKERLIAGEFGEMQELRFFGYWPRLRSYYARSPWAARALMDGRVVLDSCIGNAMAHYVQNMLFWAGSDLEQPADVGSVEAQLYRAHAIESFDTVFLRARLLPRDVPLLIVASHACKGGSEHAEEIACTRATLRFHTAEGYRITWKDGTVEEGKLDPVPYSLTCNNYANLLATLSGQRERPFTTLADSRPFVALNNLAFLSSGGVATVRPPCALAFEDRSSTGVEITRLRDAGGRFLLSGVFPESRAIPWASPRPQTAGLADLPLFGPEWLRRHVLPEEERGQS